MWRASNTRSIWKSTLGVLIKLLSGKTNWKNEILSFKCWLICRLYCQFHCEWFLQISKGEKSKSIPPSDKADSLGVRLDFMKERQHHRKEYADWSELLRSVYLCRILTSTKLFRWKEDTGLGVYFLISLSLRFVKTICNEIDNISWILWKILIWGRHGASFVDKKSTVIDVDFLSTNDAPRYTRFVGFLSTIYR